MKRDSWTGWCPYCFAGPFVLHEDRRIPEHNGKHEPDTRCPGTGFRGIGWQRARAGMKADIYEH